MQAYIISGLDREADLSRARELAALAVCERPKGGVPCGSCRQCGKLRADVHPDVITVARERGDRGTLRRELTVDQIRRISADAAILPNDAARKVYILPEADLMNTAAQNAFLKLLEEPPAWVVFVLVAANVSLLLPTVRSRCTELRVEYGEAFGSPESRKRAEAYLAALGDSARLLELCSAMEKLDSAELLAFVEAASELAPRMLPHDAALLRLEDELSAARLWLDGNVGPKHVLGYLSTVDLSL